MLWRPQMRYKIWTFFVLSFFFLFTQFILIFIYVGAGFHCTGRKVTIRVLHGYTVFISIYDVSYACLYYNVEWHYRKTRILEWKKNNYLPFWKNKTTTHQTLWCLARPRAFPVFLKTQRKIRHHRDEHNKFPFLRWLSISRTTRPVTIRKSQQFINVCRFSCSSENCARRPWYCSHCTRFVSYTNRQPIYRYHYYWYNIKMNNHKFEPHIIMTKIHFYFFNTKCLIWIRVIQQQQIT